MESLTVLNARTSFMVRSPKPPAKLIVRPSVPPSLSISSKRVSRGGRAVFLVAASLRCGRWSDADVPKTFRMLEKMETQSFASISSSDGISSYSNGEASPSFVPSPQSSFGSPVMWIGFGVALALLFQTVASRLKRYAMQKAFTVMMSQAAKQNPETNSRPNFQWSPSQFPPALSSAPTFASPEISTPESAVIGDSPASNLQISPSEYIGNVNKFKEESKRQAFVDISLDEVQQDSYNTSEKSEDRFSDKGITEQVSSNDTAFNNGKNSSNEPSQSCTSESMLSVETLEKMMQDSTFQRLIFPNLPAEMRNPESFKSVMQDPLVRQQLQEMLNNIGGGAGWDNQLIESMKGFSLDSPATRQQFEQLGLTPEEVIAKVVENPDIAVAFQNPKVQAAFLECSQNPYMIAKYQNDKEVMDVYKKIMELFPNITGHP